MRQQGSARQLMRAEGKRAITTDSPRPAMPFTISMIEIPSARMASKILFLSYRAVRIGRLTSQWADTRQYRPRGRLGLTVESEGKERRYRRCHRQGAVHLELAEGAALLGRIFDGRQIEGKGLAQELPVPQDEVEHGDE